MVDSIIDPQFFLSHVNEYMIFGIIATNYYISHVACSSWGEALTKIASWKKQYIEKFKDIPGDYRILAEKSLPTVRPPSFPLLICSFVPIIPYIFSKCKLITYIRIKFKCYYKKDGEGFTETIGRPLDISMDLLPKSIKEKIDVLDGKSDDKIKVDITDEVELELELEQELASKSKDWKDVWEEFAEIRTEALKGFKNSNADKYYRFIAERQDYSKFIEISYRYYHEGKGKCLDTMLISQVIFVDSLPKSIKEKIDAHNKDDKLVDITDEMNEWFAQFKDWRDVWQDFAEVRKDALKRFKNSNIDKYYRFIAERQDYFKSIKISYRYYHEGKGKWSYTMWTDLSQIIFVDSLPKSVKEKIDAQSGKSVDITDEMNLELEQALTTQKDKN